jgi:energy-coupling factor transporter ATP-binding protein EcfA2
MKLQAYWRELHHRRLDWAHKAYKAFMDSLDARVRACFADSGTEASVALFGRTQVGKTTLLLNLLGIDEQYLPQVSVVLRGGRGVGQSSTATAMQYHRAADDNWHLKVNQQKISVSEQQVIKALAQLRVSVESGDSLPDDPIEIAIPRKYFSERSQARPQVRILDLPGDNPKDAQEARHVRQIASRYLPMADLILIVGILDDLTFLNPKAFALPGISDWRYTPNRFRVVTTFSFTLESEKEWAKRQPEMSVDRVRAHVLEQIATHKIDLGSSGSNAKLYFPLDFGESWRKTRLLDPETFTRMNAINSQLMDELMLDIAESATVHGRLRQAADSHIVALRVKQEESQRMRILLAQLEVRKVKAQRVQSEASHRVAIKKSQIAEAQVPALGVQEQMYILNNCSKGITDSADVFDVEDIATDTGALHGRIDKCCSYLLEAAKALEARAVLPFGIRVHNPVEHAPSELRKALNKCFAELRATLDAYVFDEYFPLISDDFDNDRTWLSELMEEARSLAIQYSARQWRSAVETVLHQRKVQLDRERQELAVLESVLREYEQRYEDARTELKAWNKKIRDFERDMDIEAERGERFSRYLGAAFDEELAQRRQMISNESSTPRKLLQLLSCKQLCDERDKLICG